MKNLVMGLVIGLAITGCATKGDLRDSNAALEQRMEALEISEACHGKTLELFLFSIQLRSEMANVTNQQQADAMTEAQFAFMSAQNEQQNACKKLAALLKKQQGK